MKQESVITDEAIIRKLWQERQGTCNRCASGKLISVWIDRQTN